MKKSILYFILITFNLLVPYVLASEAGPVKLVDEDDYLGEVPTVLSVSRLSQPISDAPSAVTVIDKATIRASGIVDLPEIFRLVPGFYVGANAGYVHNTNHTVSYHGMTNAYSGAMQVMIDGRSVYSPLYGGVQWSELPLAIADIERIEVTRGPNAASYGANSYFGVINIITQHPSLSRGNAVIATHGNGRNEVFYRMGGQSGDLSYRVTTGYRQDDGLDDRNDFKRTRLLNARADYQVDYDDNLELEFGLVDGARGEGNVNEDALVFLPRTKQISNHHQLIRWRHNISATSDFMLQAYHSFERSDDQTTSVNLRPAAGAFGPFLVDDAITVDNLSELERYDIEAQHNFSLGQDLRFVWGGSVRRDSVYAPFYLGTSKKSYFNLQRVFGHAEWQAHEKILFNVGSMVEHNSFTGTDISPRVSVNFKMAPQHTLRIGASSALRTPSYVEEKFNRTLSIPTTAPLPFPNPTLLVVQDANLGNVSPEQIISKEIGYLGKIGELSVDARLFYDRISNHIDKQDRADFVSPPGVVVLSDPEDIEGYVNRGSAEVNGFETQVQWRLAKRTNLLFNFTHVRIRETKAKLARNYEQSMPSNTISALFTHQFNPLWDGSLAYYQTSKATLLGDGDPVDLIRRCDVRLARKFKAKRLDGELSIAVENLFNSRYEEFADYNTAKRRARFNATFNF